MKTDIATNLYFPKEQYAAIKQIAKKLGVSIAEYIRRLADKDIKSRTKHIDWEHDSFWNIVGIVRGKETDLSVNHDYYLYGGKKVKK